MNPLAPNTSFGTAAELLVQLRLWQFGVQASAPLKDSGNDLIAVFGETFRAIQVKATASDQIQVSKEDIFRADRERKLFHVLALVFTGAIPADGSLWNLGEVGIYLLPPPDAPRTYNRASPELAERALCGDLVRQIWNIP
ncbi:MAG: hypothetical protein IT370_11230 [Deltaproteobacteria bacterium]|nr:hypothetical protein [Deltaproteobacteria bacterium]